ncbi:response regulator [Salaquimonas pukyongi]|uniref:response regulator n=1 Tax=Salaquimonas pukyongi TaxID=2712698 RepID=UPI00096B9AEE|nr:response regulator [Salaquimonas pukyongi]
MRNKFNKYRGWHGWILRVAYVFALVAILGVSYRFYNQQNMQNRDINAIRVMSDKFAALDAELLALADKAQRVAETFAKAEEGAFVSAMMAGMTLKERKAFLKSQPVDSDIVSPRTGLLFYQDKAEKAFDSFLDSWRLAGGELSSFVVQGARFATLDDPFKHHVALLNSSLIEKTRTKKDIYWASRQITENYNSFVRPTNAHFQDRIRLLLDKGAQSQGRLLETYLLFGLGLVGALLFLVFIPVDVFLQRLLNKLEREHFRAEEALRKAESADNAKSEFLANMSHEIRTPMNGVMGMAELLAKTELNARQKTFTDIIVKSGASLLTIINDILDFSKIDAGQLELDPAPFRLGESIEDVAALVSSRVAEKDIELIVRISPDMPAWLIGDVGRVRQVVTNVIGNAIKFTEKGHVYVNAHVTGFANKGKSGARQAMVRIEIEDTGIGIPEAQLDKVFEKFSQVDGSSSRNHEGTGLGLSIASSLVDLMGGTMGVQSTEGEGSLFWIEVPFMVEAEKPASKPVPRDVSGSRVLIVDDNEVNRAILSEQLSSWQFDHAAAASGAEAIELLKVAKVNGISVDCVILDYHMPGMNGGDTVRAIRADAQIADIPVVMLTSVDQTEDGKTFSSLGVQRHLTKPTRSALLLETLVEVIGETALREQKADEATKGIMMARQIALGTVDGDESADGAGEEFSHNSDANATAAVAEKETHVMAVEENGTAAGGVAETAVPDEADADDVMKEQAGTIDEGDYEILVCEDNEVNQIVFTQILLSTPYRFHIVNNGEEGLAAFRERAGNPPKLILMDVSMPKMNGLEATAEIRRAEAETGGRTPIIGVTAHAIKGDQETCINAGMDDYLSKPVSPEKLIAKIDQWISGKQASQVA